MAIGLARSVGDMLIPIIVDVMKKIEAWYEGNREVINQNIVVFVAAFANALEEAYDIGVFVADMVLNLIDTFGGLRNVLMVVAALMAAWTMTKIVSAITTLVGIVELITAKFLAMGVAEAFASGGMSLIAGGAAAIAAGAFAAHIIGGGAGHVVPNGSFSSAMPDRTMPSAASGPSINSVFNISAAPGTSQAQAEEISRKVNDHHVDMMRLAAASAAGPVER
jgi:hypothetical protein